MAPSHIESMQILGSLECWKTRASKLQNAIKFYENFFVVCQRCTNYSAVSEVVQYLWTNNGQRTGCHGNFYITVWRLTGCLLVVDLRFKICNATVEDGQQLVGSCCCIYILVYHC